VQKVGRFSLPPGYTGTASVSKLKLAALQPVIDAILGANQGRKRDHAPE